MGLFSRTRDVTATPADTLGTADVIRANANTAVGKATQFYKQNTTLVHGIGLVASAILLNRMRKPR